ncbi:MBL fold metallo-hydrolase [Porphyromonas cangingivalis]|uniref:MBL fold metallo-hydrolase n=1 Tax=Porphyromonas cangingivalis TaxID=36874 RepID=UPI000691311C|nr:MBL fold metallo-hydrolase [Porphyromonas cangingivalis]
MTTPDPIRSLFPEEGNSIKFASLGSGSSGNCYYLAARNTRILIDAGVAPRMIVQRLKSLSIPIREIGGIFITHDHADHIRSVGLLATKYNIPVYASPVVAEVLLNSRYISEDLSPYIRVIEVGETLSFGDFEVCSFEVPHDSSHNVGYSITTSAGVFSLITDIGHINDAIRKAVRRTNFLVFESNYDPEMLVGGGYPDFLKQRIMGGQGHISNKMAADFMAELYHLDLKFLALCHLSKHNNHPELAYKTMETRLFKEGIRVGKDLSLHVLGRSTVSPLFELSL